MTDETATTEGQIAEDPQDKDDAAIQQLFVQLQTYEVIEAQARKDREKAEQALSDARSCVKAAAGEAVLTAYKLGHYLERKKVKLKKAKVDWASYLERMGIGQRSASDYMRLASNFSSAANLGASIRESLDMIPNKGKPRGRNVLNPDQREAVQKIKMVEAKVREGDFTITDAADGALQIRPFIEPEKAEHYIEQTIKMADEDEPLPDTMEACHEKIRELRRKLNEVANAMHVFNMEVQDYSAELAKRKK